MLDRLRRGLRRLVSTRLRLLLAAAVVVGVGMVPVLVLPTNSDVSWLLFAADRVLAGATLFVDVIEVNPPLIVWISLPPVALAGELGVALRDAFVPWVAVIAALSLYLVHRTLPRVLPERSVAFRRAAWLLFLASALAIPDWVYGQREHLMYLLVLPYLVGASARAGGREPSRGLRAASALMAGVGIAIKPYFLPFWVAVEGWIWLKRRRVGEDDGYRPWVVENRLVLGVLVAYGLSVLLFAPEFFAMAERLAPVYTGVHRQALAGLLLHPVTLLTAFAAVAVYVARPAGPPGDLAVAATLASVAWLVGVLLQLKGWWYHYYPSFAGSTVAVGLVLSGPSVRPFRPWVRSVAQGVGAVVLLGIAIGRVRTAHTALTEGADFDRRLPETTALVERLTREGDDIAVLSPHIHAAFPLVNRVDAGWRLRFNSMWPLEVVYAEAIGGARPVRYRAPDEMGRAERYFWDSMLADVARDPPELILLDHDRLGGTGAFDYRWYFGRAPAFARLIESCRRVAELGRYRILDCRTEGSAEVRGAP